EGRAVQFQRVQYLPRTRGRCYARTDGKVFQFLKAKCESAFLSKRNPRHINWTSEEIQKKRTRRAVIFQRAITSASFADIMAKRNQKPEEEAKKAKQASKKTAMAAGKAPTKAAPAKGCEACEGLCSLSWWKTLTW
ncbi:60S ribosomal protein L24, partial [Lemmus lemmus]